MEPYANRFCDSHGVTLSLAVDGFLLAKAAEGRSEHTLADYRGSAKMLAERLDDHGLAET